MPDEHITCAACGQGFVWTSGEERFYRERRLQRPRRCPACRRANREIGTAAPSRMNAAPPTQPRPVSPPPRSLAQHPQRRRPSPQRTFGLVTLLTAGALTGALAIFAKIPLLYAWVLGASVMAFLTYGYDKTIAGGRPTRVPEATLLLLALVGGTLGAMLGMLVFRHKVGSKTTDFRAALAVVVAVQVVAALVWTALNQP